MLRYMADCMNLTTEYIAGDRLIFPDLGTKKNPSLIYVCSQETPQNITGWECGAYWCDECSRWTFNPTNPLANPLIQIRSRLRSPAARFRQGLYTYTGEGWTAIDQEFANPRNKRTHGLYIGSTADNPYVKDMYETQKVLLTADLAKQYLYGGLVDFGGRQAFSVFSEDNIEPALTLDSSMPLQLMVDFNLVPSMTMLIGQHNQRDDMLTVVDEIVSGRDVRGMMSDFRNWIIRQYNSWPAAGFPQLEIFGDVGGRVRSMLREEETSYSMMEDMLHEWAIPYRLRLPKASPLPKHTIDAFNCALRDVKGGIHWQCHPRCQRLIEDLRKVRFNDRGEIDKKTIPELTHASDAESYRIYYLRNPLTLRKHHIPKRFGVKV